VTTATLNIQPNSLNFRSQGQWITACIELSEGYDVNDINVFTTSLNDTVSAEPDPTEAGDCDSDGIPDLMVKFNRSDVIAYISNAVNMTKLADEKFMPITLTITGNLNDGTAFQGSDTIRIVYVIPTGKGKAFLVPT